MSETNSKIVELHFPLQASQIPSDHAYLLYSAISDLIPTAHEAAWLGIHTIKGQKLAAGTIKIARHAKLRLRLPIDKVSEVYSLAGAKLELGSEQLRCGIPEIHMLKPAKRLRARCVLIKVKGSEGKSAEQQSFTASLAKQIADLGIKADFEIEQGLYPNGVDVNLARRAIRIKDAVVTGYGVILNNLNEKDSILIQETGLGGRRRMGCGLFDPIPDGDD